MDVLWIGGPQVNSPSILAMRIFRIGALLYEMLSGLPPFYSRSREVMFEKIMKAELNFSSLLSEVCLIHHKFSPNLISRLPKIF